MKKIISFLAAAIIMAGCTTSTPVTPEKQAIDRVFAADLAFAKNSSSITQVVMSKKTLSLAGCPSDFVSAYKANISAWEKLESIEKKMYTANQNNASADVNSFLGSYASDAPKAFVTLKGKWNQFSDDLDSAFADIEKTKSGFITVGAKYSCVYPKPGLF